MNASGQTGATTRVCVVTGMSGAGKSTALRALEDLGYEAVDNLPLSLLGSLARDPHRPARALAIGIDSRTRDFDATTLIAGIDHLAREGGIDARLVFLDCDDEELRRRFTQTRRRHPLAQDRPVADGIRAERALLKDLIARADLVLDTSTLAPGDLKRMIEGALALDQGRRMTIAVVSFAYRYGLPREADLVFDVRFLANPFYQPDLKEQTGRDSGVAAFIAADPGFAAFFDGLTQLLAALLPRYEREGKSYLTVAIGCTGGRHRSVFVAERLAAWLGERKIDMVLTHRDLAAARPAA